MLHIIPVAELHTVQVNSQCREHRIGHSRLVEPRHVLRQQLQQRRQFLRHRWWRGRRTAASLHASLRLQRLQHLFQPVGHTLLWFLQGILQRLAILFGLGFPVVRNDRHHLLQRIAADATDGHRQFKRQCVTVTLHRLLSVVEQFPILLDNRGVRDTPVTNLRDPL